MMVHHKRVLVLVGTRKGAFIYESDEKRNEWQTRGPYFPGWTVQHMKYDARAGAIFAALDHMVYGSNIHRSFDLAENWEITNDLRFPDDDDRRVSRIWHVQPGHKSQPDVLFAGADPGALFRSVDGGMTWQGMEGINDHETRDKWGPGAGGLMVHTIIQDPENVNRLFVAISAAGVFRSDDGGNTWHPKNNGVLADFLPNRYPEVGQCCHHLVMSPTDSNTLYQQNHCGVYRTNDGGDHWIDIGTDRLPSTFGFPMAIHPRDGDTVYVVPLRSDEYRYTPEGRFRVYRSRNGGENWEARTEGLPQINAYLNVFREGMAVDPLDPAGVYVGTGTGQLYFSRDDGDHWRLLADTLPPIYSVGTALIDQ